MLLYDIHVHCLNKIDWLIDWKFICIYLPLTILHSCMTYESCMLKTTQVIIPEPKCWQSSVCDLGLWSFDLKMYKYLPLTILHHSMYEISILKTIKAIASEPNFWQRAVCDLDLWTQKCIGIFLYPSLIYMYVWDMKAECWKEPKTDELYS